MDRRRETCRCGQAAGHSHNLLFAALLRLPLQLLLQHQQLPRALVHRVLLAHTTRFSLIQIVAYISALYTYNCDKLNGDYVLRVHDAYLWSHAGVPAAVESTPEADVSHARYGTEHLLLSVVQRVTVQV